MELLKVLCILFKKKDSFTQTSLSLFSFILFYKSLKKSKKLSENDQPKFIFIFLYFFFIVLFSLFLFILCDEFILKFWKLLHSNFKIQVAS